MKRVILLFLTSVFICLAVACYDDKGSYDYKEVNEIEVDSLGKHQPLVSVTIQGQTIFGKFQQGSYFQRVFLKDHAM